MKKGQISIFIIIGLIVLIITGYLLYTHFERVKYNIEGKGEEYNKIKSISIPLQTSVESCLKTTTKEGAYNLGRGGGFFYLPPDSEYLFTFESGAVDSYSPVDFYVHYAPYYYKNGKSFIPDIVILENQLAMYIKNYLPYCINFSNFNSSINIKTKEMNITTKFINDKVKVFLNYPIKLGDENVNLELKDFSSEINFNFLEKYNLVKKIIDEQKKSPNTVPLGFIINLAYDNNFYIETYDNDKKDFVEYNLFFNEPLFEDKKYNYAFVIGYNWGDL